MDASRRRPLRLFYSYSHRDETFLKDLQESLILLKRETVIEGWHDRDIDAGDDWKRQIDEHLEQADIILLLVSRSFLASDYCYKKEMSRALERHAEGLARVIPIIIRPCDWQNAPFASLNALPRDGKAITTWPDHDEAWLDVTCGIRRVVGSQQDVAPIHTPQAGPQSTTPPINSGTGSHLSKAVVIPQSPEPLLPSNRNDLRTMLCLIITGNGGRILRPAALDEALGRGIQQEAQFGSEALFYSAAASTIRSEGNALLIEQQFASVLVDDYGSIRLTTTKLRRRNAIMEELGVVEEDVHDRLITMLHLADRFITRVDLAGQITDVAILAAVFFSGGLGWKTLEEYKRDSQTWSMHMGRSPIRAALLPHARTALVADDVGITADLIALLQRELPRW